MLEEMGQRPRDFPLAVFSCLLRLGIQTRGKKHNMTTMTPDEEITTREDRLASLVKVIGDLRQRIEVLATEGQSGGKLNKIEIAKVLSELNTAVVTCAKVETALDEHRNKQAGIARGGFALDLVQARADIGCKLDQLRQCGNTGTFPE
jgi:hypothetical protein